MICRFADFSEYAHETTDLIGAPLPKLHSPPFILKDGAEQRSHQRPPLAAHLMKIVYLRTGVVGMKEQVEAVHYIVGADSQIFFKPRSPPILLNSPYYPPTAWVAQVMYRWLAQGLSGQALQWHCALQMLWESYARPGQRYPRSFPKTVFKDEPRAWFKYFKSSGR